jgi:hypothetical protein
MVAGGEGHLSVWGLSFGWLDAMVEGQVDSCLESV